MDSPDPLLEVWKDGQTYAMTPRGLVEELTYSNYKHNRQRAPDITPEQWRQTIPEFTEAMEARYQRDQGGT